MTPAGFKPAIPENKRPLGSAQNVISSLLCKCGVMHKTLGKMDVGKGHCGRVQTGTDRQLLLQVEQTDSYYCKSNRQTATTASRTHRILKEPMQKFKRRCFLWAEIDRTFGRCVQGNVMKFDGIEL
jgi:hypothetical protein